MCLLETYFSVSSQQRNIRMVEYWVQSYNYNGTNDLGVDFFACACARTLSFSESILYGYGFVQVNE